MSRHDELIETAKARIQESRVLPSPEKRREIREKARLTQREFGEVLGISGCCISYYEKNREPSGQRRREYGLLLDRLQREVLGT